MNLRHVFFVLIALVASGNVSNATAQSVATPSATPIGSPAGSQAPLLSIAPAAADAVAVVNSFMIALSTGDLAAAQRFLDPAVIVIANATIYGNRDAYLNGPAKGDAIYLQKAQRQLLSRQARAGSNFAWVISEKILGVDEEGRLATRLTTETMLLAKTLEGWKIIHIDWSSRPLENHWMIRRNSASGG